MEIRVQLSLQWGEKANATLITVKTRLKVERHFAALLEAAGKPVGKRGVRLYFQCRKGNTLTASSQTALVLYAQNGFFLCPITWVHRLSFPSEVTALSFG